MAGKNLLVNGKNNITARANAMANIQADMANRTTASNVNTTPKLPTRPTAVNLQKAQTPINTKLNNLNNATMPTGTITGNNPAFVNGQLTTQNTPSRFIGFQKPKTDLGGNLTQEGIKSLQPKGQNFNDLLKPTLYIPTEAKNVANETAKNSKEYKANEDLIKKFHYAVKNANGQLTADDIKKQFKEWNKNVDAALQLQADIRPLVQQGQFADMNQISEFYSELLPKQKQADTTKLKEQEEMNKNLTELSAKADKILSRYNTLSNNGVKVLEDYKQLSEYADYLKKNYRLVGDNITDADIINFAKENIPEVKQLVDEIQQLEMNFNLTEEDRNVLYENGFDIGDWLLQAGADIQDFTQNNQLANYLRNNSAKRSSQLKDLGFNASSADALGNLPSKALSIGSIPVNMLGELAGGIGQVDTALERIAKQQNRNEDGTVDTNGVMRDIVMGGGGAMTVGWNTVMAIPTAIYNLANETEVGAALTDTTIGNADRGLDKLLSGKTLKGIGLDDNAIAEWYNDQDEQTQAEARKILLTAIFHKGSKGIGKLKKLGNFEINAVEKALGDLAKQKITIETNSPSFKAKVEQGLADGLMKISDDGILTDKNGNNIGKVKVRKMKTGEKVKYVVDKVLSINRAAWNARSLGELNPNALPDNRTFEEKADRWAYEKGEQAGEIYNSAKEGIENTKETLNKGTYNAGVATRDVVDTVSNVKPGEIVRNTAETVGKGVKATSDLIDSGKNAVTQGKNKVTNTISKGVNAVKETVNENIIEPYNKGRGKTNRSLNGTEISQQGTQQLKSNPTSVTDNKINGDNYTQKNTNSKPLNSVQLRTIQSYNRMNPKTADTFKERYGEDYGQFLADRGFTKSADGGNLNDMVEYKKDLLENKNELLNTVEGTFKDQAINDMIDHIVDYVVDTVDRKNEKRFKALQEKANNEGLTMSEINDMRQWYSYHVKTGFFKEQNAKGLQKATNIYDNLKDFLDKIGEERGLTSLREINKEIMKIQHIIGGVSYKMNAQGANNLFGLTDYVLGATLSNPETVALFLAKQVAKMPAVKNAVANTVVGRRGNAKNRITKESKQGEKENIKKINEEKRQQEDQKKRVEAGRQLQSDLSKSDTKALPNKGGTDGGKNILTNGKTIITDAKGNSKVKGQISEIDNRPTKPSENPVEQPKETPKQEKSKNIITKKETKKAESKPKRITAPKKERQIIKNDKGENEIVYHGTNAKFDKFDKNFIGRGGGFRFTTSKGEAESYGKNVKEYNLMASNIMDFDSPEFDDLATQIIKQYTREKFGEEFYISPEAFIQDEGLRNYAQELGYDALKFSKGGDTKYIVYNEDQIIPVQKQPKAKTTKTSKNKVTNPSKAKTTSLFNENEVDKGNKSEGLNPDALPLSDYREIQRLTDGKFYSLGDSLKRGKLNTYMATKITTDLVGNYDEIIADEFDPENLEDEWVEKYNEVIDMYDAYEKGEIEEANGYADELIKGKTAKELIDQYTPEYESDLKIYNRLSKKYPGFANGKIDLTGEQGRAMREFASQENETSQDIDYQELAEIENQTPQDIDYQDLAELENETPQMVDIDEGVDATTQLIDEFNNLKPGEFKWIGDNREAGVRKTFLDANIKIPGEGDSVDIYFQPGESGDKMYINLHDTSNTGIRNTNEVLNKLDIPYRIGSEFDEKLNETRYYLENKLTHSKAYFDKNGASWLSVSKTLRGKEIVPRRNAEEQAEYNMQMEQRRAEIEAEREQDRIKAEERKAEEERQQEIDKQMKANLLRYVDIKHNDNPLGRGRTLKDLSEKNSEASNKIRYYGDDVADDAGVWQVLDVLADKNGKIREVWESDSKSSYSYEYYDEELGRNNNISGLNKTQRDYLEYRIKASQTEKRVNNHLDKIENKSLKTRVENKLNEMKKWQDDNGKTQYGTDAQYIDYLVLDKGFTPKEFPTGKTYANGEPKIDYMIVNEKNVGYISSKIENDYARSLLETPEEELSAEDEAKLDELFTPKTTTEVTGEKNAVTAKEAESEKPKNLVTSRIENTKQEIQEIDKDTYFDDIVKNLKDHPREMFIYKDGNYFYPHYILPSGKVITPENTYWGEVSSEEAARNWLLKEAEEHSEENETKKAEKLKEIVGKTAEKYEATLKRIESDNPMQEIWTSGDYFKYGMGNNQMARAKKESEANAEVGTFKKDVIDGKEGYRIFVAGTKNEAIRAFYEPKTGKTYRIYRGPVIDDSKPYTTKQVERIEKFLENVEKQLDKETKKEKVEEKDVITQEWLDSLKPDENGVVELDPKGGERYALAHGKGTLVKEGKADGKYLYNYATESRPQYRTIYIKDGKVYDSMKGINGESMTTKQDAIDWLNEKEKDVAHEGTPRYEKTEYETLPKTVSVESEAEKAGPKRIAPDRVKWQQETYDKGLENVKDVIKAKRVVFSDLGFKSLRGKAVKDIWEEKQRIEKLPESEADAQWTELARGIYEGLVIKDISKGYRYPEDVTSKFPKAQMQKAIDARARYEKGLFTSFSAKDTRANNQYRDEIGAGIKSQDGKPVTQEQMNEIVDGIRAYSNIFGVDMKKFAEDNNVIYVHLHGGNPFLMGGMSIAGLYRRDAAGNISVSLGGREGVMEKGEDGKMKKSDIKTTTVHEITHAVDGMLEGKLFSDADVEILKKTMNKPSELINYYNRKQEIVARAVEQYAAHQLGKKLYRTALANIDWENGSVEFVEKEANYVDREAYWNQENFDKYVKPIVERNMNEKMKDYKLGNAKKNVLGNDKNKITSGKTMAASAKRPSITMNVEEWESKNDIKPTEEVKPQVEQRDIKGKMYHVTTSDFENFRESADYNEDDRMDWNDSYGTYVTDAQQFFDDFMKTSHHNGNWRKLEVDVDIKKAALHPYRTWKEFGPEKADEMIIDWLQLVDRFTPEMQKELVAYKMMDTDPDFDYDSYDYKSSYTKDEILKMPGHISSAILDAQFVGEGDYIIDYLRGDHAAEDRETLKKKGYDAVMIYEGEKDGPIYSYALFYPNKYQKNVVSNGKNNVTAARVSRPSIRMNVDEREKKNEPVKYWSRKGLKKVGESSDFGPAFEGIKGQDAIDFLLAYRDGEVRGAYEYNGEPIDLVWGKTNAETNEKGFGLSKIEEKHKGVLKKLHLLLTKTKGVEDKNGIITYDNGQERAIIMPNYDKIKKKWILNAYLHDNRFSKK